MSRKKQIHTAQAVPSNEELKDWGIRALSFEELLAVNGGRHVIDDPRTDNVSDTIANGGHSPGGSSSSSDESSSDSGDSHGSGSTGGSSVITGSSYTVQEKDTLSDIVRRRYPDASAEERVQKIYEVAEYSGITDIDRIEIGQIILFEQPAAEGGAGTPPVQQGGGNIGLSPGGTQAGSVSGTADTVGQSGNENSAPVQGPSLPGTGGVASVPPAQNESGITQQAASAQNPVPQMPAAAEPEEKKGLFTGLKDWGKRKLDSIGQGIVGGAVYAMDVAAISNQVGVKLSNSKIRKYAEHYNHKRYIVGKNEFRCDNYVEAVVKDSGRDPLKYFAGAATEKNVEEHILNAKEKGIAIQSERQNPADLTDGVYIVFMNNSEKGFNAHAGLLFQEGGQSEFRDNCGNNTWKQTDGTMTTGGVITQIYSNLQAFQADYNYKDFYYIRIN